MRNENSLENIAQNLLATFPLIFKKILKKEESGICKNLTPSHTQIMCLLENFGSMPISEIGKKLCISPPNMTPLIDKLIEENLVERIPNSRDRRIVNISLTENGKEFLKKYKECLVNHLKLKLSDLTEEEQEELNKILSRLKEIILKINE